LASAGIAAGLGMVIQWTDTVPGRGGTMGGEMTAGILWAAAALLAGVASLRCAPWWGAPLMGAAVYACSVPIRLAIGHLASRGTGPTG
jgi:hypothetical protein